MPTNRGTTVCQIVFKINQLYFQKEVVMFRNIALGKGAGSEGSENLANDNR